MDSPPRKKPPTVRNKSVAQLPTCHLAADPSVPSSPPFSTRIQLIFTACACADASAFLYTVDPNQHAVYPQCLFYRTTGFYCAGCGATRALHALFHGRLLEALHDNALFIAALPIALWVIFPFVAQAWRGNAWPSLYFQGKSILQIGIGALGLMMAFMILRNLPGWPFELIKPLTLAVY